jgi:uncharacterized membrane protein
MTLHPRLLTRIALFSALAYALSWASAAVLNVSLIFFVIFSAGYLWGAIPGMLVGAIGMGLWTWLNPYGPAMLPVAVAQIAGAASNGLIGAWFRHSDYDHGNRLREIISLGMMGIICSLLFHIPVNAADAWVFQPFWPRFLSGMGFALLTILSNAVIFPLLFGIVRPLYDRERSRLWNTENSS